jgi:DNA invertase Pin-like site-specific DNA recombinase
MATHKTTTAGRRDAIYPRVSTKGQEKDGTGNDIARSECEAEMARRGWVVDAEFVYKDVESGANDQLTELQRLLADARAGKLRSVTCLEASRFGRSQGHAMVNIEELVGLGVAFVSVR